MLKFGDVVRVDPRKMPQVRQPDNRRWMVVGVARTYRKEPWTTLFLHQDDSAGVTISHWPNLYGFCKPEEVE